MMDVEEQITVTLTTLHRVLATVFIDGKETENYSQLEVSENW